MRIGLAGISVVFFAIFLMSAIFQHNDQGIIVWILFYYALTVLALVGIALHCGLFVSNTTEGSLLKTALYGACLGMMVFSIVLLILSAVAFAQADSSDEGQDAENLNDKEEKAFEMGGAILGLISTFFHLYSFRKAD